MRRLKIALLSTHFWAEVEAGGSLSHITGFVGGLVDLGHEVHFIGHSVPRGLDEAVVVHKTAPPRGARWSKILATFYLNLAFPRAARRVLRQVGPDFVYQRCRLFDYTGPGIARSMGLKLVLEFNSSEVWTSENWGRLRLAALAKAIERANLRNADAVTVVSKILRDDLEAGGVESRKILVNPNGVDTALFKPELDGRDIREKYNFSDKLSIGFIGTFGIWHGALVLVKAIKKVVAGLPEAHFLLIGKGVDFDEAQRIVQQVGVGDRVTFAGTVAHEAVPGYLAACDILVSPHVPLSGDKEFFGSPTKLFEYMAMGRGIVASDLGQIGDILLDGRNALLVKPGDVNDLAQGILTLAADPALRRRLGAQAALDAADKYTWTANARRVIDHLDIET